MTRQETVRPGWLAAAFIVGAICAFLAMLEAGAGHGTYLLAHMMFPWIVLAGHLTDSPPVLIGAALLQFPGYECLRPLVARAVAQFPPEATLVALHGIGVIIAGVRVPRHRDRPDQSIVIARIRAS